MAKRHALFAWLISHQLAVFLSYVVFVWLISHQPTVLFSPNKPATSNQPVVLFSQNKPAPAISHQPNEQAAFRRGLAAGEQRWCLVPVVGFRSPAADARKRREGSSRSARKGWREQGTRAAAVWRCAGRHPAHCLCDVALHRCACDWIPVLCFRCCTN
jgi:hypothetical protein